MNLSDPIARVKHQRLWDLARKAERKAILSARKCAEIEKLNGCLSDTPEERHKKSLQLREELNRKMTKMAKEQMHFDLPASSLYPLISFEKYMEEEENDVLELLTEHDNDRRNTQRYREETLARLQEFRVTLGLLPIENLGPTADLDFLLVNVRPLLHCAPNVLSDYILSMQDGDRVREVGQSSMTGREGTVVRNSLGVVCIEWDIIPGEKWQLTTSFTTGARKLTDIG